MILTTHDSRLTTASSAQAWRRLECWQKPSPSGAMVPARLVQPEPEKVRAETLFDGIRDEFRLYAVVPPPCWWGWVVKWLLAVGFWLLAGCSCERPKASSQKPEACTRKVWRRNWGSSVDRPLHGPPRTEAPDESGPIVQECSATVRACSGKPELRERPSSTPLASMMNSAIWHRVI